MLHVSCTVQVQAKMCWVNCRIHTCLKHSHLLKAQFPGKVGSCFLKVHAASLICPCKLTQQNSEHDNMQLVRDKQWHVQNLTLSGVMRLHNNVVSLVYLLFHMNWSIPSYSVGKLTIRMMHVPIVVQCHS